MDLSSELLFFFSLIGVFNGFIISFFFLFFKKPKMIENVFLGFFLFFMCEALFRALIYHFEADSLHFYLLTLPLSFIFIGPFLFLYILYSSKPKEQLKKIWMYHIGFWSLTAFLIGFFNDLEEHNDSWVETLIDFINLQWLLYMAISLWTLRKTLGKMLKKEKCTIKEVWLLYLLLSIFIVFFFGAYIQYDHIITGAITFSFFFYIAFLFFLLNRKKAEIIFSNIQKYGNKKIKIDRADVLIEELQEIMKKQKLYKNHSLKSSHLAEQLDIPLHKFSQLLNDNLKMSFPVFINQFRIEEAKRLLYSETDYTIEHIGQLSGFKSRTAFYNAFKKHTGITPSEYKDKFN